MTPRANTLTNELVIDQLHAISPKCATLLWTRPGGDILALISLPKAHRAQIHSTNTLGRPRVEVKKRRTGVLGIFPDEAAVIQIVFAVLCEQNDEWCHKRPYMQLEGLQRLTDNRPAKLSAAMA